MKKRFKTFFASELSLALLLFLSGIDVVAAGEKVDLEATPFFHCYETDDLKKEQIIYLQGEIIDGQHVDLASDNVAWGLRVTTYSSGPICDQWYVTRESQIFDFDVRSDTLVLSDRRVNANELTPLEIDLTELTDEGFYSAIYTNPYPDPQHKIYPYKDEYSSLKNGKASRRRYFCHFDVSREALVKRAEKLHGRH